MRSLTVRLLVFNLLLVFFPLGSMLILDTYEKQLLSSMERSMVQQGRIFSAAVSGRNLTDESLRILKNLKGRQDARIRIVDTEGRLLADSSAPGLLPAVQIESEETDLRKYASAYDETASVTREYLRDHWLYKMAVFPVNVFRNLFLPPNPPLGSAEYYSQADILDGPEVRAALAGRYGAMTRYSSGGQRSVNLYSAIPVLSNGKVNGAVLVSRSTYRILTDLYSLRLDMVRIFLWSLLAAVVLSLLLARSITIPVKKLRDQAESFIDHRGRVKGAFSRLKNRDEIGDLSRSLYTLSGRLEEYVNFISGFSADMSHEMKNPVASIASAAELSEGLEGDDQKRFFHIIKRETGRISRLLDDLRDISQIDVKMDSENTEVLNLADLVQETVRMRPVRKSVITCLTEGSAEKGLPVKVSPDRIVQILNNLLDNAESFTSEGQIRLVLIRRKKTAVLEVLDSGPGLPEGTEEKVFDRFYSDRPDEQKEPQVRHSGLGLSIVRSITEAYGGTVTAETRKEGGACFRVMLPLVSHPKSIYS